MRRLRRRLRDERGAAAVEFALILPVLVLMVFGIMEYGLLFNEQISLQNAAREGARTMAIDNNVTNAKNAAIAAAPSITPALTSGNISVLPGTCTAGAQVTVTVTHTAFATGLFGPAKTLTGKGVMRCAG